MPPKHAWFNIIFKLVLEVEVGDPRRMLVNRFSFAHG